jgi:hypothetical protein
VTYLSEFRDYLTRRTDAPAVFHLHAGLCSLAVAMGVGCWVDGPGREVYPNLNSVLLAPSGMGKSVPLDMATNIVRKAGLGDRLLPASFSQEGVLRQLSKQNIGFWVIQEFAAFQALLGREYNDGAQQTLTELSDVPEEFTRQLRKADESYTLRSPCITILGASSPDWFADAFKGSALRGGWLARFLFCPSREAGEPIGDPGPRDAGLEASLADHLRRLRDLHGRFDTEPVKRQYDEYSTRCRLAARESADFGGMRSRGPVMALKVAMLFHVSRDPTTRTLAEKDMRDAIAFVDRTREAAESYLTNEVAHDRKDAERMRLVEILRGKGGYCAWSVALKNSHMDKLEFQRAVETLVDGGTIKVEPDGRAKFLRLCEFATSPANSREVGESAYWAKNGTVGAGSPHPANFANSGESDLPF